MATSLDQLRNILYTDLAPYLGKGTIDALVTLISDTVATVTKETLGLDNVDNTSDVDKPISTATSEALEGKIDNDDPIITFNTKQVTQTLTGGQVDLSRCLTSYSNYTIDAPLVLSVKSGSEIGGTAVIVLVADGTNIPTYPTMVEDVSSAGWVNTAATKNRGIITKFEDAVYIKWDQIS